MKWKGVKPYPMYQIGELVLNRWQAKITIYWMKKVGKLNKKAKLKDFEIK